MSDVYKQLLLAVIRHAMTSAGPTVVGMGLATEADWTAVVGQSHVIAGIAITGVGLLWSFVRKWRAS